MCVCVCVAYMYSLYPLPHPCEIEQAEDDAALREACQSGIDIIIDSGYTRPLASVRMSDRAGLIGVILQHAVIYRVKAVLDQIKEGLKILGVGEAMCKYPDLLKPFFVAGLKPPLTTGTHQGMSS